ncbi:MAG TPA: ATP-dependent DNA helicase [Terriglobales bacterium]|nr:ATP-dependent DNA helicase [Terriglobales bacterium]
MSSNGHHAFTPTPRQRQAIEHVHGPMLVVAGAGTGKTAVLSRRIAHLINTGEAKPDEILAVTYTRNGAAELITRAAGVLYPDLGPQRAAARLLQAGLQANTFHTYCFSLLRDAGIKFALLDDQDLFVLLRRRIGEMGLDRFIKAADPGKFLRDLMDFFRRCHDELRTPEDYDAYLAQVERNEIPLQRVTKAKDAEAMPREEVLGRCHEIARAFRYVEDLLKQEGLGTFGHIITRAVEMLGRRQSVLQAAQKRARFILIDEFQDSNVAQIQLAKLLGGENANVFAVGDPDQAIYRFRGATSGAFDQFLKTFGAGRVQRVTMSENRRSTPPILSCAYHAIRCNPEVGSVELEDRGWPREPLTCARQEREKNLAKAPAVHAIVHNKGGDAAFIADTIETTLRRKPAMKYRDFAVLYRQHIHRGEVADELRRRGIPVQVCGADLFDAPQVRDAMAALRIIDGPDPVALFRVAALPQFCVDAECFRTELALAGRNPAIESVLEKVPGGFQVMEVVREARHDMANANGMLPAAIRIMRSTFQIGDSFPLQRLQEFAADWSNKPQQITRFGTLSEFLEYVTLFQEAGGVLSEDSADEDPVAALAPKDVTSEPQDAVQLMTVHAAKGLEFPCVFVLRVVSQSFPGQYKESLVEFPQELRSKDTAAEGEPKTLHAEEERRLFYVALTRAMDELYICGQFGRSTKDPTSVPPGYMRELLDKKHTVLQGAIDCRKLSQGTLIEKLHAAAEPVPLVSEWVQLPPRADARLSELSASAIDQYERCPLAYKLSRDWRIPEGPAARMQFGAAMHLALKAYFDGVHAGRPPDEETVIACFLDEFSKTKIEEEIQRDLYEKEGREQLIRFLRSELARPHGEILNTERNFSFAIGETNVRAKMDRLDQTASGEVVIVDYKTGKPKTQEDADKSLQLSIYALAARDKRLTASSLVFINLENCTAVQSSRSPQELIGTERKVVEVARKIAAGEFDPNPGFGCNSCSYHSICPAHEVIAFVPAEQLTGKAN